MECIETKKKLFVLCRKLHDKTIQHLKLEIDDSQKSANEYGTPKDRYDSYRIQLLRKKDMFGKQLSKTMEQIDTLDKISLKRRFDKVEFGALVITDKQKIFVSIGLGKIELEGSTYFAISPNVPVFIAMEGKKAGEEYEFRGDKIKILSIC